MGIKEHSLLGIATPPAADILELLKWEPSKLGGVSMTHYHIRWSGNVPLDWECFSTPAEAEVCAKQLLRAGETYIIEEYDETCPRCRAAMEVKSMHNTFNEASA
jgi:phage FluMu protein Com